MNDFHYSLEEIPLVWLILLAIVLLVQGTWIFRDARRRGRFPWLWGLWGITSFPMPLIIYWFVAVRADRRPPKQTSKK